MADKETFEEMVKLEIDKLYPMPDITYPESRKMRRGMREGFQAGATFAHSIDGKRITELEEGLKEIMKMKLMPNETDYKYIYNRCWHIANKALNDKIHDT